MKVCGVENLSNTILKNNKVTKPVQEVVCKSAVISTGLSAAALSGMYLTNKVENNQQAQAIAVKNNSPDKKVIDEKAVKFFSKVLKNGEKYLQQNKNNIKELSFTPASENTKYKDVYKLVTVNGVNDVEIHTSTNNKLYKTITTKKKPDGTKTETIREIVNDTDGLKITTTNFNKDNMKTSQSYETDLVHDSLGLLHKTKIETEFNENGKAISRKTTKLDGQNSYTTLNYDKENKLQSAITTEYTKDGLIKSQTKASYKYPSENEQVKTAEITDFENHTKTTAVMSGKGYRNLEKEVREITDPKTGKVRKEILEKSDVDGIFNTKIIDENGVEKTECLATKDKNGNIMVEKHLESLDGTRTEYNYTASKNNQDVKMFYQITDKNGKILTTVDREFHRLSNHRAMSSLNGYKHAINYYKDGIVIEDLMSGKKDIIKFSDLFKDGKIDNDKYNFIGKMSADMLLNIKNRDIKLDILDDITGSRMCYKDKTLKTQKNMRTFSHESGHAIDTFLNNGKLRQSKIRADENFRKTYEQEKSEFLKHFNENEKKYIDYFISGVDGYNGMNSGIGETIAEINSMFSTEFTNNPDLNSRFYYLQKYFPRTVAIVAQQVNPHSNLAF